MVQSDVCTQTCMLPVGQADSQKTPVPPTAEGHEHELSAVAPSRQQTWPLLPLAWQPPVATHSTGSPPVGELQVCPNVSHAKA
jgi:hypothetical protein